MFGPRIGPPRPPCWAPSRSGAAPGSSPIEQCTRSGSILDSKSLLLSSMALGLGIRDLRGSLLFCRRLLIRVLVLAWKEGRKEGFGLE